ncbi:hypothetical protein RSAG8_00590, partial [Rhizoctonia solani AG-8 WAC10335]
MDRYLPPARLHTVSFLFRCALPILITPCSKRYTTDVLHSLVSQARDSELRTALPKIAASSLNAILRDSELVESLLVRHSPPENDVVALPTSPAPIDSSIHSSRGIPTA